MHKARTEWVKLAAWKLSQQLNPALQAAHGDQVTTLLNVCACVYIYIYDFMIVVILIMLCRNKQECSCWNFLVLFCCKVRFRWVIRIKTEFLSLYLHKVNFTFLSINVNFQWSHMDDIRYFKDLAHFAIRICLYRTDFFDCWSFFFFLID